MPQGHLLPGAVNRLNRQQMLSISRYRLLLGEETFGMNQLVQCTLCLGCSHTGFNELRAAIIDIVMK